MRFNDLTHTILAAEPRTGVAATSLWRQCVDILAQYDQPGKPVLRQEERVALMRRLHEVRDALSEAQRIASVVELGSRLRSPALVELFAGDRPSVCAAAIARARLPDPIWPVLLPRLGPTARGVLRGRRDLGPLTRRALEAFGPTDLVLDADPAALAEAEARAAALMPREEAVAAAQADATTAVPDAGVPQATAPDEGRGAGASAASASPATRSAASLELVVPLPGDESRVEEGTSQIRRLVERIEQFTNSSRRAGGKKAGGAIGPAVLAAVADGVRRGDEMATDGTATDGAGADGDAFALTPDPETTRSFPFETDAAGELVWVGDALRPALVGLSIAHPALPGDTGPDGHVAGAFTRRSSFQNGRFVIGTGPYAGEWRLSAVPFFDPASGRFQGYRGQARRPLVHEMPQRVAAAEPAAAPSFDSMRQIIHELRTPLNAILGFAEIIEQQLFGPADAHYREMAGNILVDARRLLAAFDDIDLAARSAATEAGRPAERAADAVDMEALIGRLVDLYDGTAAGDGAPDAARLRISLAAQVPPAFADPVQCERMVQHLTRTLVSIAEPREMVQGSVWYQPDGKGGRVVIGFDRPRRLRGLEEQDLFDPGYGSDGDWPDGPFLGLGFSLRLVRSLAQSLGGGLRIETDRLLLDLPLAGAVADGETA